MANTTSAYKTSAKGTIATTGKILVLLTAAIVLLALAPGGAAAPKGDDETLRQYADKMDFGIGVFIQPRYWKRDPQHQQIMGREFNRAVTFPDKLQVERGHYDFELMDEEMQFAKAHNMKLFGAGLLYRNNASPEWLHFEKNCGGYTEQTIEPIIKEDITTIVRHGGDMYYAWEIVNEPVSPGHNGCWSHLYGGWENGGQAKMIAHASQYAHEANPNVPILLNDTFGQEGLDKAKVDDFFNLVKKVNSIGGHLDAVGTEMHLEAQRLRPTYLDEFKYFLDQARKAHVTAQVTEIDVYQGPAGAMQDPFENQKTIYYNIAHACLQDTNCTTFTTWGLYDTASWLHEAKGLTDAKPLMFDERYQKKPAYYGVLQALKEGRP
jgi:endo-1,4-beta-xylanase